jgi:hypothetical protein
MTIEGMDQVGFAAFSRGFASNRSIASMAITECQIDDQGATALATGFSEKNDTLKEISIWHITDIAGTERITKSGWDSIITSIAGSRLEMLDVCGNRTVTDAVVVTLSNSLLSNGTLKYLDLGGCNSITHTGLRALFQQLLNLKFVCLNDIALLYLANALANNSMIKELYLGYNRDFTPMGWGAFSTVLLNHNSALEKLHLDNTQINNDVLHLITINPISNVRLRDLNLSKNDDVTSAGWVSFTAVLWSPASSLDKLYLKEIISLDDVVSDALISALRNNSRLRELHLAYNGSSEVTNHGWMDLSTLLQNSNSALEVLNLQENDIGDDTAFLFAEAVDKNTLKELNIGVDGTVDFFTSISRAAFTCILCNTSNILDTYNSNHAHGKLCNKESMSRIDDYDDDHEDLLADLRSILMINKDNTKCQAACIKIINTHFRGPETNTEVFACMKLNVLPIAIAWMGRDCDNCQNINNLFSFLTSMPLLCD